MTPLVVTSRQGIQWKPGEIEYYENYLSETIGLTYTQAETCLGRHGNTPGCHWPLVAMFTELARQNKIHSVLELGSGMTTIFLARLSMIYGIHVTTLENHNKWFLLNQEVMKELEIVHPEYYLAEDFLLKKERSFDCLFVDSSSKEPRTLVASKHFPSFEKEAIIFFDDCEQDEKYETILSWAKENNLSKPGRVKTPRGIATIDPARKINFVEFEITPEYLL